MLNSQNAIILLENFSFSLSFSYCSNGTCELSNHISVICKPAVLYYIFSKLVLFQYTPFTNQYLKHLFSQTPIPELEECIIGLFSFVSYIISTYLMTLSELHIFHIGFRFSQNRSILVRHLQEKVGHNCL